MFEFHARLRIFRLSTHKRYSTSGGISETCRTGYCQFVMNSSKVVRDVRRSILLCILDGR